MKYLVKHIENYTVMFTTFYKFANVMVTGLSSNDLDITVSCEYKREANAKAEFDKINTVSEVENFLCSKKDLYVNFTKRKRNIK